MPHQTRDVSPKMVKAIIDEFELWGSYMWVFIEV